MTDFSSPDGTPLPQCPLVSTVVNQCNAFGGDVVTELAPTLLGYHETMTKRANWRTDPERDRFVCYADLPLSYMPGCINTACCIFLQDESGQWYGEEYYSVMEDFIEWIKIHPEDRLDGSEDTGV